MIFLFCTNSDTIMMQDAKISVSNATLKSRSRRIIYNISKLICRKCLHESMETVNIYLVRQYAIISLQSIWRGSRERFRLTSANTKKYISSTIILQQWKIYLAKKRTVLLKTKYNSIKREEAMRSCILRCLRRYQVKLAYKRSIKDKYQKQQCVLHVAVVTLQNFSLRIGTKRKLYKEKMLYFATIRIQTKYRGFLAKGKAAQKMALCRYKAAAVLVLQLYIRRYLRGRHLFHDRRLKLSRNTCILQRWWRMVTVKLYTSTLESATTASHLSLCETSIQIIVPIVLDNTANDSPKMEARACASMDHYRQINRDRCLTTLKNKWRASWIIRKTQRESLFVVQRAIVRFWLLRNARKQFLLFQMYTHKCCLACQCTVRVWFAKTCTIRLRRARKDRLFRIAQVEFASVDIWQNNHNDCSTTTGTTNSLLLLRQRIIQASVVVDCGTASATTSIRNNYAHNRILATAKPPPPWAIR